MLRNAVSLGYSKNDFERLPSATRQHQQIYRVNIVLLGFHHISSVTALSVTHYPLQSLQETLWWVVIQEEMRRVAHFSDVWVHVVGMVMIIITTIMIGSPAVG